MNEGHFLGDRRPVLSKVNQGLSGEECSASYHFVLLPKAVPTWRDDRIRIDYALYGLIDFRQYRGSHRD
jgi:hypothetical protein